MSGIVKATWATWLGDHVRLFDRDAQMKDRAFGLTGTTVSALERGTKAIKAAGGEEMEVAVDSPQTTTTTTNNTTNNNYNGPPAWMYALLGTCIGIMILLLFLSFIPHGNPTPTPTPIPVEQPGELHIKVDPGTGG